MPRAIDRFLHRRVMRRIAREAAALEHLGPDGLARTAARAGALSRAAGALARAAGARAAGLGTMADLPDLPARTEWAERAAPWHMGGRSACPAATGTGLAPGASLYHDGEADRLGARLWPTPGAAARFGLVIDTTDFTGSYLSVSLALPAAALSGMTSQSLFRAAFDLSMDRPLSAYVRLNVRHGPNTEQLVRALDLERGQMAEEFDLFYADLLPETVSELWVDLIFERPELTRIDIRDAILSRRPRASL